MGQPETLRPYFGLVPFRPHGSQRKTVQIPLRGTSGQCHFGATWQLSYETHRRRISAVGILACSGKDVADRVRENGNRYEYEIGEDTYAIPKDSVERVEAGGMPTRSAAGAKVADLPSFTPADSLAKEGDPRLCMAAGPLRFVPSMWNVPRDDRSTLTTTRRQYRR